MSLQDVEKKLMASAEEEARQIIEKAQAEARAELERRSAALRDDHQRKLAAAKADADAAVERETNSRRAEHTMKVLQAKTEVLEAVFAGVRGRALAGQGFDYARWLASQVRQACAQGVNGSLACSERDRVAVERLVRECGASHVAVSPQPGQMSGGIYLTGEGTDLDFTLDAALADLREELGISLAERLFGDVPPIAEAAAPGAVFSSKSAFGQYCFTRAMKGDPVSRTSFCAVNNLSGAAVTWSLAPSEVSVSASSLWLKLSE